MKNTLISVALVTTAATALSGCGSSGSTPSTTASTSASASVGTAQTDAAICARIKTDVLSLGRTLQNSQQDPNHAATALLRLAQKLETDANLGSQDLQSGVSKLTRVLTAAAQVAKQHTMPDLRQIISRAQAAEKDIGAACSNVGG